MSRVLQGEERKLFQRLIPIRDLPPASIEDLAEKVVVLEVADNRPLFNRGDRSSESYYLLSGEVELEGDGESETLIAGSSAALLPLGHHQTHTITATSHGPVTYFHISNNLLEIMIGDDNSSGMQVDEIEEDDDTVENQLFYEIYQEYMDGTLQLPTLPELALRVRRAVGDPEKSLADVVTIVQSDPAITGRLIDVANSPLYRTEVPASSCMAAVKRLGLNNTRDLVTTFTLRQLFKTNSKPLRQRMQALWVHSTHVAAISAVLADMTPALNADRALLAGLIHDIGVLAIYGYVSERPELLDNERELDEAVYRLRGQVGAMVLRKWSFASDLVSVVLEADNFNYDSDYGPDYADVVLLSQIHSYFGTPRAKHVPPLFELPAFGKLPLSHLGPEKSIEVLKQAHDDIEALRRLLGA